MRHAGAGDKEREIWKGSHPWEPPEAAHVANSGLQALLPVVESQLGKARLFLAVEKGLRQQERTHRANPQQQIHAGRNGESSVVSATFCSPGLIPRLGTHTDTQEHVEMWSQVPHSAQKPHSHSYRKLSPDFPSPPVSIELQVLSVLSFFFFPPLKKTQTNKGASKYLPKSRKAGQNVGELPPSAPQVPAQHSSCPDSRTGDSQELPRPPGRPPALRAISCVGFGGRPRCFAQVKHFHPQAAFPEQGLESEASLGTFSWSKVQYSDLKGSSSSSSTQNPKLAGMEEQQEPPRPSRAPAAADPACPWPCPEDSLDLW